MTEPTDFPELTSQNLNLVDASAQHSLSPASRVGSYANSNPWDLDEVDNIIRAELHALTAFPPPVPFDWVFSPKNDEIFFNGDVKDVNCHKTSERISPNVWVERGVEEIKRALST